jgi:hypothetical protein
LPPTDGGSSTSRMQLQPGKHQDGLFICDATGQGLRHNEGRLGPASKRLQTSHFGFELWQISVVVGFGKQTGTACELQTPTAMSAATP